MVITSDSLWVWDGELKMQEYQSTEILMTPWVKKKKVWMSGKKKVKREYFVKKLGKKREKRHVEIQRGEDWSKEREMFLTQPETNE